MFVELLRKEFIARNENNEQKLSTLILFYALKLVLIGCLVALECFIFLALDKKIESYSEYGTFDFLVMFLFVMMLLSMFSCMVKGRRSLFDQRDSSIMLSLPISPSTIIFSKVTYLFVESSALGLVTATPLLVCYGATRMFIPYYYVFSILYPFLVSLFSIGLSLVLSLLYQYLYVLIRRYELVQLILASVLVIGLCFVYQVILRMFLSALSSSASIEGVFSKDFVNGIHEARPAFVLVFHLLDAVILKDNIFPNICISLGSILLSLSIGVGLVSFFYYKGVRIEVKAKSSKGKKKQNKLLSPFKSLLKKEVTLLFHDESNLFSYTSLLIMGPFLTFVVISSLNDIIYDNLEFYASYFPELISGINLTLILLFSGSINASASLSMSREGKGIKVTKTLPVPVYQQMIAKILIPFSLSELSLFITDIVLIATGVITVSVFFSSFFIGSLLLLFTNVFGLYADMHDREAKDKKNKLSIVNELVPLILPLILFALFFLFSVYLRTPGFALYLIAFFFSLIVLAPIMVLSFLHYKKAFYRMEVTN